MDYGAKYLILLVLCLVLSEYEADDKYQVNLSRKRRYVVFPEGSTFSIALCLTVHTLTPDNIFTEGLNWGISYDLPNESKPALEPFLELRNDKLKTSNKHDRYGSTAMANRYGALNSGWNNNVRQHFAPGGKKYRKSEYYYLQRRHRRELYNKLEVIMNAMGFDGRTCVLRALCEASQRLMPKGNTLIEEMMRISFSKTMLETRFKRFFLFDGTAGGIFSIILQSAITTSLLIVLSNIERFARIRNPPKEDCPLRDYRSIILRKNISDVISRLPLERVFSFEPEEHRTYTQAHKAGHEGKDCAAMFPGCSFSLIDLALGKYNAPPFGHPGDAADHAGTFGTEDGPAADWPRYNMR